MRKALSLAIALIFLASSAQAQGRDRGRDDDEDWWRGARESRDERGRGRDEHYGWREGRYHGARGARFFVRSGENSVGIVCDSGDSMRSCVDAALTLWDRVRQAGPGGTSPSGGSASPPARP